MSTIKVYLTVKGYNEPTCLNCDFGQAKETFVVVITCEHNRHQFRMHRRYVESRDVKKWMAALFAWSTRLLTVL